MDAPGLRAHSPAGRWVIAATVLGSGMAAVDATVVGIALPTIGRDFHASLGTLQWVVTGYTLTLASLLLIGGSLGDRFGRKRVFMVGVAWFALASAACSVATGSDQLIITRLLQGVGGALLTPGSLAIIEASFAADDRSEAIGLWSGLGGVATAAGPLLGGYLITAASWRWIFLINVPLGAAVLLMSARHVPESSDPSSTGRIDVAGALLATVALGSITFTLINGASQGWASPGVLTTLVVGVAGMAAFLMVEHWSASPMLPLNFFANRQFAVTNAVTFVVYAGLGGALFLLPVTLQVVNHYSPLESGVALLPLTLIMLVLSARSGRLAASIGPRLQMSVGPVVVGAGMALLARVPASTSYFSGVLSRRCGHRPGAGRHGGPVDRHRPRFPVRGPRRHGLRRQQRRGSPRQPDRRGRTAGAGRDQRIELPPSPRPGPRLREGGGHRRFMVRPGRYSRGHRHQESDPGRPAHAARTIRGSVLRPGGDPPPAPLQPDRIRGRSQASRAVAAGAHLTGSGVAAHTAVRGAPRPASRRASQSCRRTS